MQPSAFFIDLTHSDDENPIRVKRPLSPSLTAEEPLAAKTQKMNGSIFKPLPLSAGHYKDVGILKTSQMSSTQNSISEIRVAYPVEKQTYLRTKDSLRRLLKSACLNDAARPTELDLLDQVRAVLKGHSLEWILGIQTGFKPSMEVDQTLGQKRHTERAKSKGLPRLPYLSEGERKNIRPAFRSLDFSSNASIAIVRNKKPSETSKFTKLLFSRELGQLRARQEIRAATFETLKPSLSFHEMSGDVNCVSFSPDGSTFSVGGICLEDEQSQQFNDSGNLVVGNVENQSLIELGDHHTLRKKTAMGTNSTDAMHLSQDERLWKTISAVDFDRTGRFMLSSGFDSKIRSYDLKSSTTIPTHTVADLGVNVDLLRVNKSELVPLVATGCSKASSNIAIWNVTLKSSADDGQIAPLLSFDQYSSGRSGKLDFYPRSLEWGTGSSSHLIAVGFGENNEDGKREVNGHISIYDLNRPDLVGSPCYHPSKQFAQSVFDMAWSPSGSLLASAVAAPRERSYAKSFLRVYAPHQERFGCQIEMDCEAGDINDVVWCPYDDNYLATGATNGCVYVYDRRNPNDPVHVLHHGDPSTENAGNPAARESWDTGIRFCGWNQSRTGLVSGGSDGVVKVWDIMRSTKNSHRSDLVRLRSGVMAASYNCDFTKFIVGEMNRSFTVLEVGKCGNTLKDSRPFRFTRSPVQVPDNGNDKSMAPDQLGTEMLVVVKDGTQRACEIPCCKLPLCRQVFARHEKFLLGGGKIYDSARSESRIPASLLDQSREKFAAACHHCGNPVRIYGDEDEQINFLLCKRCGFACFRCGERTKLNLVLDRVRCKQCGLDWEIGALGYNLRNGADAVQKDELFCPKTDQKEARVAKKVSEVVEDELLDYYNSLWGTI
jgi:WD40 repeat protein